MKLSISNIAWSKANDLQMYEYISKQGFKGIEIAPTRIFDENPYDKLQEAEEFAKELKSKFNLDISSMQSIWYGKTQKIFGSIEERKELIEYTKKAIDFAEKVHCRNLVFGCPKNRNIEKDEDYKIALEFFREIGEYAKAKGVVFAIEPNPTIYNTNFINTTKEAIKIVKDINCDGVKINLDFGTIIQNNEDLSPVAENLELINHIHISEPNLVLIEKRPKHEELFKIIVDGNYDNYVSIEMKTMENLEDVKKVILYVKEVFGNDI